MSQNRENPGSLGEKLQTKKSEQIVDAEKRISSDASWFKQQGMKDARSVYSLAERVYAEKAEQLKNEILKLKDKASKEYLLDIQDTVSTSIQARLDLMLTTFGTDETDPHSVEMRSHGVALLQGLSVPSLIYDHLKNGPHPELATKYEQMTSDQVNLLVPDFTDVVARLNRGEINEADWDIILKNLDILRAQSKDWIKNGTAMALIAAIPEKHRTTLLRKMMDWPDFGKVAKTLVLGTYVTVAQVNEVVSTEVAVLTSQLEASAGASKKEIETKIVSLQGTLAEISSPAVAQAQAAMEKAKTYARQKMNETGLSGTVNSVRQMLTFRGILGSIAVLNGTVGLIAGGLMHLKDPLKILEDPAIKISAGMALAGLQMNKGFGNMVDTPLENASQLITGKNAKEEEKRASYEAFERDIGRYPKAAELYVQFSEQINAAYTKKRQETLSAKVDLTLEEMGIAWEKLPNEFHTIDKKELEGAMSHWVSRMAGEGTSGKMSPDSQRDFIQKDCREKYGLPPYEKWDEEKVKLATLETKTKTIG